MNWQEKLKVIMDAYDYGHPLVRVCTDFSEPCDPERIDSTLREIADELEIKPQLLQTLRDLYAMTDGKLIAMHFKILGLKQGKFGFGGKNNEAGVLRNFNALELHFAQEIANDSFSPLPIRLIFGLDEVSDYLCLAREGAVINVGTETTEPDVVAASLDEFLEHVCMGAGFVELYKPVADDFWLLTMKELGFL